MLLIRQAEPQDTAAREGHFLPASVVRWHVFQDALQTARGRRLMFVDACHSGGAYNTRLVKEARDAEIVVFSATDSQTLAQERAELGHGAFTFALTQGLSGGAAIAGDDVALTGLLGYVSREVNAITGRRTDAGIQSLQGEGFRHRAEGRCVTLDAGAMRDACHVVVAIDRIAAT